MILFQTVYCSTKEVSMLRTANNGTQYECALDHCVEFFSKAGSLMVGSKSYYGAETTALALFQNMWAIGSLKARETAMKLLFWLRDPRGGAGNRSGFRAILEWMAFRPDCFDWVRENLHLIPLHGRWDDLKSLFGSPLENYASSMWIDAISAKEHLALKWAKRDLVPLQRVLKTNEAGLRAVLRRGAEERRTVETQMSDRQWDQIVYKTVPSVAMSRYVNAFKRHDGDRFGQYVADLEEGKESINASVLFPYQCMKNVFMGNEAIADAQFAALPNYLSPDARIMAIVDTSGSMAHATTVPSVTRLMAAVSLGLYVSDRLPEPYSRMYMEFSGSAKYVEWADKKFSEACKHWGGEVANTNIQAALNLILRTAQLYNVSADNMINTLLIISDMQFDEGVEDAKDLTPVEESMVRWQLAGYARPKIVYWNLAGHVGQPATAEHADTALVSGFSPAILKAVLAGDVMTPRGILECAIEKYQVIVPPMLAD